MQEVCSEIDDVYFLPQSLHVSGRSTEHICQLNAVVVDLDSREIGEALDALARCGIQPHYVVETSSERYQLVLKLRPVRLGKRSRQRVLDRHRTLARRLADLTSADLGAAKPRQLFRLPGTRRQTSWGIFEVQIVQHNSHEPYALEELLRWTKAQCWRAHTQQTSAWGRAPAKPGTVLTSPAIRWILDHTIAVGSRNRAIVALAYAHALDGHDQETATEAVLRWSESRLSGGDYPSRKIIQDVAACYRNPKGLSPEILRTITDENGETMHPASACSVFAYMPRNQQRKYRRRPIDELRNRPLFERLGQILDTLHDLQQSTGGRPVRVSASELCGLAGVPLGTYQSRLVPVLAQLGVYCAPGRGRIGLYDLTQINVQAYRSYAFIEPAGFRRAPVRVVQYWMWRFRNLWTRFAAIVERAVSLVRVEGSADPTRSSVDRVGGFGSSTRQRSPPWKSAQPAIV